MIKRLKSASLVLVMPSLVIASCLAIARGGAPPALLRVAGGIHASLALATNCTLFAAPNGSRSNTGTITSPLDLIGADLATSPGSVVCFLGGRYDLGGNPFAPTKSGTSAAPITYQAYGDGPATLVWTDVSTKDSAPLVKIQGTYNGVTYSGPSFLTFQGLNLEGNGLALSGFQCNQSVGVTFIANTIVNTDGAGIETTTCDYITSDHNLIYHNGYSTADSHTSGISYQCIPWADTYTGFHNLITNNIVSGQVDQAPPSPSDGNGIILDGYAVPPCPSSTTPPTLILNNIVYGNSGRCIFTNQNITNFWIVNNSCFKDGLDTSSSFQEIATVPATNMTGLNAFVLNNVSYSWTANNPPYALSNASGVTYSQNLYYGAACNPSTLCTGFINGDPQFVLPPYFDPSLPGQYGMSRPPLMGRPNYLSTTSSGCAYTSPPAQAWIPTCDIDSGFALASTGPAYGNLGVDPTTLASDPNVKAGLQVVVYKDINGNARGGTTGKWDLGAYQH